MTRLRAAGCVAAEEEADLLLEAAAAGRVTAESLVSRRERGEPLAYIVGWVDFAGVRVLVGPGAFVPRPQTEAMVARALDLAPSTLVDIGTGAGPIPAAVQARRAEVVAVATEVDPAAAAWAIRNGVDVRIGDLDQPLPSDLAGLVDVMTVNLPYVPTAGLAFLPRDTTEHEPRVALDGGGDGLDLLRRLAPTIGGWLRPGGSVLIEIGGDQGPVATAILDGAGLTDIVLHVDGEDDLRMIEARRPLGNGPAGSGASGRGGAGAGRAG